MQWSEAAGHSAGGGRRWTHTRPSLWAGTTRFGGSPRPTRSRWTSGTGARQSCRSPSSRDQPATLRLLLGLGAGSTCRRRRTRRTAPNVLATAVGAGRPDFLRQLLDRTGDRAWNRLGPGAVALACFKPREQTAALLNLLLARKPPLASPTWDGPACLRSACTSGNVAAVRAPEGRRAARRVPAARPPRARLRSARPGHVRGPRPQPRPPPTVAGGPGQPAAARPRPDPADDADLRDQAARPAVPVRRGLGPHPRADGHGLPAPPGRRVRRDRRRPRPDRGRRPTPGGRCEVGLPGRGRVREGRGRAENAGGRSRPDPGRSCTGSSPTPRAGGRAGERTTCAATTTGRGGKTSRTGPASCTRWRRPPRGATRTSSASS